MRIVLISTPIGFLGSGKGGGVELTLNSLVSGLISLGHSVEVVAPKNSKLHESNVNAKLYFVEGEDQISWQHQDFNSPVSIPDNSLLAGMLEEGLNIAKQKFSLVYYLSVGDQTCDHPGVLKLENPNQEILPSNGLIIIFPAERKHSVFYKGEKDRIIIGVNFYKI